MIAAGLLHRRRRRRAGCGASPRYGRCRRRDRPRAGPRSSESSGRGARSSRSPRTPPSPRSSRLLASTPWQHAATGRARRSPPACAPATGARSPARSRSSRTPTRSPYDLVRDLYPRDRPAYAVGVTGPPGVGKSSLIGALVAPRARPRAARSASISVDPSSPFSQGALLGDRIRLADHFLDPGVFIRSMGTRGHLGGLAEATLQALLAARRRRQGRSSSWRRSAPARARSR